MGESTVGDRGEDSEDVVLEPDLEFHLQLPGLGHGYCVTSAQCLLLASGVFLV